MARRVLTHSYQGRDPEASLVLAAQLGPWALGGHHDDVDVLRWLYLLEVDVEPVGELDGLPGAHGEGDLLVVDRLLHHVRDEHQDDVRGLRGLDDRHHVLAVLHGPVP
jgi:hypothetical protein